MKYTFDNDLHIHSKLSLCSGDNRQTPERILKYAKENNLKRICVTDHFWNENVSGASEWYKQQNYAQISKTKPLPEEDGIEFLFGCETEMDRFYHIGISKDRYCEFDFIVVPTTHTHMLGFTINEEDDTVERKAVLWTKRLEALLETDLPFHKVGIAHLTTPGLCLKPRKEYLRLLSLIKNEDMERLFKRAADLGCGIELNSSDMRFADSEADIILRPYRIAKDCGCKFYLGSDAHRPEELDEAKAIFERAIEFLKLAEDDKFHIKK